LELAQGDFVVAEGDWSEDLGGIVSIEENKNIKKDFYEGGKIFRKAKDSDLKKLRALNEDQEEVSEKCRKIAKKNELDLKIIDVYYPLNNKFIVVAFVAEERLDFRNLARELSYKFKKIARLEHISFRKSASFLKGLGVCGKELCCAHFNSFQCAEKKGFSEGLSNKFGVCGCVKCCLSFEE